MKLKKSPLDKQIQRDRRHPVSKGRDPLLVTESDKHRERALELRLESKTYRTIAQVMSKELGRKVPMRTVHKWCNNEFETRLASCTQKSIQIREEENNQIDQILERMMPLVLDEGLIVQGEKTNSKGETEIIKLETFEAATKAGGLVLKALELKAKINGLMSIKFDIPPTPLLQNTTIINLITQIALETKKESDELKTKTLSQSDRGNHGDVRLQSGSPPYEDIEVEVVE